MLKKLTYKLHKESGTFNLLVFVSMYFMLAAHPKGRLLHSKFLSALFKQKSEGPHFWLLQFGSL